MAVALVTPAPSYRRLATATFAPLQNRWNALGAAVVVGTVWGVWHRVPFALANGVDRYDPLIPGLILALTAAGVAVLWAPETLARSRFGRRTSARGGRP